MPPYLIALRATLVSTFLAQGPLKAEPDASMCVQGVYSGGDPREKKQGTIGMKKKKKRTNQESQQCIIRSLLWVTGTQCCWVGPSEPGIEGPSALSARWQTDSSTHPSVPVPHWLRWAQWKPSTRLPAELAPDSSPCWGRHSPKAEK